MPSLARLPRGVLALALPAAAAAALACGDISSPQRTDVYDWRLFANADSGNVDTLSFRWPAASQPVRIYVQDSIGMRDRTQRAIDAWQGVFLYREWQGQIVDDSTTAQVIVRPVSSIPGDASTGLESMALECGGVTGLNLNATGDTLRLPVRVYIQPRFDIAASGVAACLDLTTIHELGHVIGVWNHSTDPADIMFGSPVVTAPSERDRETVERIYHLKPNVVPAGRP